MTVAHTKNNISVIIGRQEKNEEKTVLVRLHKVMSMLHNKAEKMIYRA